MADAMKLTVMAIDTHFGCPLCAHARRKPDEKPQFRRRARHMLKHRLRREVDRGQHDAAD